MPLTKSTFRNGIIRPLTPLIVLVLMALGTAAVTVYLASVELDRTVARSSERVAVAALRSLERQVAVPAANHAHSDITMDLVMGRIDRARIDDTIGPLAFDAYHVDMILVVAADDSVRFREARDGFNAPASESPGTVIEVLRPLLERARAAPVDKPTPVSGCVMIAGRLFLIGAAAITPDVPEMADLKPHDRPVLVYLRELDETLLARIGEDYGLNGLHLGAASGPDGGHGSNHEGHMANEAWLEIQSPAGQAIGALHWTVPSPTLALVESISMPLAALCLLLLALAGWVTAGILRNVDRMRAGAEELVEVNARLVESEAQSRSAMQRAEHASRAKTGFLSNVSHELRTPLTAIIGFSQILKMRRRPGTEAGREDEYAEIIHDSSQHLLNLVNDILDLGKIESGGYELQESWLDLNREIEAVINLMSGDAKRRSVSVIWTPMTNLPALRADQRSVKQILTNLVSNALKFTAKGGEVTISVSERAGGLSLDVADNGSGIAEEDIEMIWEPFTRARDPRVTNTEGSGLGLHLVKVMAEMHGCEVMLDSHVGEGTRIAIVFPPERVRDVEGS
jgi:signal transduction histidine kinase